MHLHIPFEEIQLYAGKEGKDNARMAYPVLRRWVDKRSSQIDLRHADQIIRAAKLLPRNHLSDFHLIAVFQASLALWGYGIVSRAEGIKTSPFPASTPGISAVCSDEADTPSMQRFMALQRELCNSSWSMDLPGVSALVEDPAVVMDIGIEILQFNIGGNQPLLVENLIQLMRDLVSAAKVVGHQ
jgi:hypothetical protein